MKILLVNLPFYRLLGSHYNSINLGLGYTASSLNASGHDCWIYNADFMSGEYATLHKILSSNSDYKEYFKDRDHPIWQEVVDNILKFNPDVVGYSAYTANLKAIEIISEKIKKKNKEIWQIVGGPHARLDADIGTKLPHIDMNHRYEGEYLASTSGGVIDINDFPFPEKNKLWNIPEAQKKDIDYSYVITSRGCPYNCNFCASPSVWGRKVRFRSVENVIREVRETKEKYGVNCFYILDDTFTLKGARVRELLQQISSLDITWKCNTRLDCLDDDICALMKKSGCVDARVGVESGSDRMLKYTNKNETKQQMMDGITLLKKHDIPITCYFMAGFPTETDKDLLETIEFAKKIEADYYSLSVFAPYYGSRFYNNLINSGVEFDKDSWEFFYHQSPKPLVNNMLSPKVMNQYFALSDLGRRKK